MESPSELDRLRTRIKQGYILWIGSLLALMALVYFYEAGNAANERKSEPALRAQIARDQVQIDVLSADLLRNQRDLKQAQHDLLQLTTDYKNAMTEIKRLQARP